LVLFENKMKNISEYQTNFK